MAEFKTYSPDEWRKLVHPEWFTPKIDPKLYKFVRPIKKHDLWSGSSGEVFIAHIPNGVNIPKYHYSVAYELTSNLISDVKSLSKVLIKPNNTGFVGAFMSDPRLQEIMRINGISEYADLQPIATQPAMLAGIVDALLDAGVDEIHIGENMLWAGGTPRAFWETGYIHVFSDDKYKGKVFFVDLYEEDTELVELPIKANSYDLGFFTKTRPPKALFDEMYDLVVVASIAKMHNCSYYSLLIKNFSVTWNPRRKRWHIHGIPLKLFDREYATELLNEEIPKDRQYEIYFTRKGKRRLAFITNGLVSTSPLVTYREEGELLAQVDPHHLEGLSLATLMLGIGYLIVRYTGMFATVSKELQKKGTRIVGLISGIVGQEGEGPLVYGARRFGGFALAGDNFPAMEALSLDIMTGFKDFDFSRIVELEAIDFGKRYDIDVSEVFVDTKDLWTLKLAEELTAMSKDYRNLTAHFIDFEGLSDIKHPWDIRTGPPFRLPEGIYVSPRTWLRMMYLNSKVYLHAMDYVDKGIEIPLIPPV